MALFPVGRITVPFRGKTFTVREMTAAERDECRKVADADGVPFLLQNVFMQVEWPEDCKPANAKALGEEPYELVEKLAEALYGMSGLFTEEEAGAKKAS